MIDLMNGRQSIYTLLSNNEMVDSIKAIEMSVRDEMEKTNNFKFELDINSYANLLRNINIENLKTENLTVNISEYDTGSDVQDNSTFISNVAYNLLEMEQIRVDRGLSINQCVKITRELIEKNNLAGVIAFDERNSINITHPMILNEIFKNISEEDESRYNLAVYYFKNISEVLFNEKIKPELVSSHVSMIDSIKNISSSGGEMTINTDIRGISLEEISIEIESTPEIDGKEIPSQNIYRVCPMQILNINGFPVPVFSYAIQNDIGQMTQVGLIDSPNLREELTVGDEDNGVDNDVDFTVFNNTPMPLHRICTNSGEASSPEGFAAINHMNLTSPLKETIGRKGLETGGYFQESKAALEVWKQMFDSVIVERVKSLEEEPDEDLVSSVINLIERSEKVIKNKMEEDNKNVFIASLSVRLERIKTKSNKMLIGTGELTDTKMYYIDNVVDTVNYLMRKISCDDEISEEYETLIKLILKTKEKGI